MRSSMMAFGAALAAILFVAFPAAAVTLDTALGEYESGGTGAYTNSDRLAVGIASDPADKGAGFVMTHAPEPGSGTPGESFIMGFLSTGEWAKFIDLWNTAISTPPPPKGEDETMIGEVFDQNDFVLLSVAVETDRTIQFIVASKDDVSLFTLAPADFPMFDENVKQLTAYFGP